jgi:hypothetical protein
MDAAGRKKLINRAAFRVSLKIIKNPTVETSSRSFYCLIDVGEENKEIKETKVQEYFKILLKHGDFQLIKVENESESKKSNLLKFLLSIKRATPPKTVFELLMQDLPNFEGKYKVTLKLSNETGRKKIKK